MELKTLTTSLDNIETAALAVGVFTQKQLTPAAKVIDQATNGAISKLLESEFKAKKNTHIVLRQLPNVKAQRRSEEHTSELQSRGHLVCRLLLEKKKKKHYKYYI